MQNLVTMSRSRSICRMFCMALFVAAVADACSLAALSSDTVTSCAVMSASSALSLNVAENQTFSMKQIILATFYTLLQLFFALNFWYEARSDLYGRSKICSCEFPNQRVRNASRFCTTKPTDVAQYN